MPDQPIEVLRCLLPSIERGADSVSQGSRPPFDDAESLVHWARLAPAILDELRALRKLRDAVDRYLDCKPYNVIALRLDLLKRALREAKQEEQEDKNDG